jgi:hypothetical protein
MHDRSRCHPWFSSQLVPSAVPTRALPRMMVLHLKVRPNELSKHDLPGDKRVTGSLWSAAWMSRED